MGDIDPVSVWRSWFNPTQLARPASPNQPRTPGPLRHSTPHASGHGTASWHDQLHADFAGERIDHYLDCLTIRESKWKFETSAGGDISIGTPTVHVGVNVTGGALWLKEGDNGKPIE